MGRSSVDKTTDAPNRQVLWSLIRKLKEFTVNDLAHKANMNVTSVRSFVTGLEKANYIKVVQPMKRETEHNGVTKKRGSWKSVRYKLIKDIGQERPFVDKNGQKTTREGTGRDRMWRTMKMLKTFTPRELSQHSSCDDHIVNESEARHYVQYLYKAGYLQLIQAHITGTKTKPRKQARYRFINKKNTGPRAPMIQRVKAVFDPNINKIVYTPEPRDL